MPRLKALYLLEQKVKTRVVRQNVNPEWNDELTLSVADPRQPIKVVSVIGKETSLITARGNLASAVDI